MLKQYWRYYRNSLADSDRMMPDDSTLGQAISISLDDLLDGKLSEDKMRQLTHGRWNNHDPDEHGRIALQFAPWIGKVKPEHGVQKAGLPTWIAPLWLPFKLMASGIILPDEQRKPWIPRNLLEPIYPARLVLGSVQDLDYFLTLQPFQIRTMAHGENELDYARYAIFEWLKYGQAMLNYVSKLDWTSGEWPLGEYVPETSSRIMIQPRPSAAVVGLLNIFDRTTRDQRYTDNLSYFLLKEDKNPIKTKIDYIEGAQKHIATWPNTFPLSASQRKALHYHLSNPSPVKGLNGPPGTGKTTLIAMLLLQKWAEAALLKKNTPPIFLLAAANNQALNTLLSASMKEMSSFRWINSFSGTGLLCLPPSRIDAIKAENIPWTSWLNPGVLKVWGSEEFVQDALYRFTKNAHDEFGTDDLVAIQAAIHKKLQNIRILQDSFSDYLDVNKNQLEIEAWQFQYNIKIDAALIANKDIFAKKERNLKFVKNLRKVWGEFNETNMVWTWLLKNVPGGETALEKRNRKFFEKVGFVPRVALDDNERIDNYLRKLYDAVFNEHKELAGLMESCQSLIKQRDDLLQKSKERAYKNTWAIIPTDSKEKLAWESKIDEGERAEVAKWTIRYWECVWLQRMIERWGRGGQLWSQDPLEMKHKWETWGCITPFFGSTVYTAPRFFLGWQGEDIPLYELFNTIVIDEAAQVVPEAGIGIFPLGKEIILAGDPEQLEPLWGVPERTDVGNALAYEIIEKPDQWAEWKLKSLSASSGNLMKRVQMFEEQPIWLEEQHRSHPDLVRFANRLCYGEKLKATRLSSENAFGFIHVNGVAEMWYGSRYNVNEAEVIATFVNDNIAQWRKRYPNLRDEQIVGVITPFVKQTHILKQKLHEQNIHDITIGTVHAFQGSERPIIIFSPVEQLNNDEKVAFFNQDRKFLNVTVSRSRDKFYVIGNLNGWSPNGLSPASILTASFAQPANIQCSSWIPEAMGHGLVSDGYIYTADYAEEWLIRLIDEADKYPVHIASPLVNPDYVDYIGLIDACQRANSRGIEVILYVNKPLQKQYVSSAQTNEFIEKWQQAGGVWYWRDAVMDNRIWNGYHIAESNQAWLTQWTDGVFRLYSGESLSWTDRQARQWGLATN